MVLRMCSAGIDMEILDSDDEQSRVVGHLANVAAAKLLARVAPALAYGRAFNLGASRTTTTNEVRRMISQVLRVAQECSHESVRPVGGWRFMVAAAETQ